jgi:hypothetical protein
MLTPRCRSATCTLSTCVITGVAQPCSRRTRAPHRPFDPASRSGSAGPQYCRLRNALELAAVTYTGTCIGPGHHWGSRRANAQAIRNLAQVITRCPRCRRPSADTSHRLCGSHPWSRCRSADIRFPGTADPWAYSGWRESRSGASLARAVSSLIALTIAGPGQRPWPRRPPRLVRHPAVCPPPAHLCLRPQTAGFTARVE